MSEAKFEIRCDDCGNIYSGSGAMFIDQEIGEIVCKGCGLVSSKWMWRDEEFYENECW